MKKKTKVSGNTREQLVIPGMEVTLSSVDSEGSRAAVGKNTYDPTWEAMSKNTYDPENLPRS